MMDEEGLLKLTFADRRLGEVLIALKEGLPLPYSYQRIARMYEKEMAIGERATHELAGLLCSHFWDAQVNITFHAEGFCLESHHPKVANIPLDDMLLGKIQAPDEVMGWQALGECDEDSCHSSVYPDKSYMIYKPRERAYDLKNGLAHRVEEVTTRLKGKRSRKRKTAKLLLGEKLFMLDLRGIRFICPDEDSCYYVDGFVDGITNMSDRLSIAPIGQYAIEDYIRHPQTRENGNYKSIHRNVIYTMKIGNKSYDIPIEIQIRDREMHQAAEEGEVSHEEYAELKEREMLEKYGQEWIDMVNKVDHTFGMSRGIYSRSH